METYLLDTNIISDLADAKSDNHPACMARLQAAVRAGDHILLPVMAIAEIEFGLQKGGNPHSEDARRVRDFLRKYPLPLPFDDESVAPYALIRSKVLHLHPQPRKKKRPEEWCDRVTGKELGIDERDLIIASAAVQYNVVLVTDDRNAQMQAIQDAAKALVAEGHHVELRVDNWRRAV
jgi:predicted nucleic acid-binding protein